MAKGNSEIELRGATVVGHLNGRTTEFSLDAIKSYPHDFEGLEYKGALFIAGTVVGWGAGKAIDKTVGALRNIKPGEREFNGLKDIIPVTTNISRSALKAHLAKYNIPLKPGWDADRLYDEVLSRPKGSRPNPEDYLPAAYIAEKLSMFDSGIVRVVKKSSYDNGKLYSGDEGFAMPESEFNRLKAEGGGSFERVAARLDLGVAAKADDYVIVRLDRSQVTDLRLATGNETPQFVEYGANLDWLPGIKTKSGTVEAVFKVSQNIDLTILTLPLP